MFDTPPVKIFLGQKHRHTTQQSIRVLNSSAAVSLQLCSYGVTPEAGSSVGASPRRRMPRTSSFMFILYLERKTQSRDHAWGA